MLFLTLYADRNGEIFEDPEFGAVGRVGSEISQLQAEDMIPLPDGAQLMFLPGRIALGRRKNKLEHLAKRSAVAAILPVGYTRTHLPAYALDSNAPNLPLYGYCAVALKNDQIYAAAKKTDDNARWHPFRYNTPDLAKKVGRVRKMFPNNRIVEQLAECSLQWHCCTAQNIFYHRWEAGIPVSPACNANCLGCISLQPSECCPSAQNRIRQAPTVEEIVEVGVYHLADAPYPIISFGQGCEGEPSLEAERIAGAIRAIRRKTQQGFINMNTNGGYTQGIKKIVDAGLQQMRVSVISAVTETHNAYYRANYGLEDVMATIRYAKQQGVQVSLNMLLFPGLNDLPGEINAWIEFVQESQVDMIQLRNLNIDPDWFMAQIPQTDEKPLGVAKFLSELSLACPGVKIGNFTHYGK